MRQHRELLTVTTRGAGLVDVTGEVQAVLARSGLREGLATVLCRHTSASLVIQENADPSAAADLLAWLDRLAPRGDRHYTHVAEGPDDMPAHLRSAVTRTSESIPFADGRLDLGTWQGLQLLEHRDRGHRRELLVHLLGE